MYESFDRFLQAGIKEHYERSGSENKTRFVSLVIVSGEVVPMAVDALKGLLTPGRMAAGALGALALRVGLRWAFSGPVGMVLTGLSVASLVHYYFTHQKEIWEEVEHSRRVVRSTRERYDGIQAAFADGRYGEEERTLMLDGLMQRFLRELDEPSVQEAVVVTDAKPAEGADK